MSLLPLTHFSGIAVIQLAVFFSNFMTANGKIFLPNKKNNTNTPPHDMAL
jgi:hypothetical protein